MYKLCIGSQSKSIIYKSSNITFYLNIRMSLQQPTTLKEIFTNLNQSVKATVNIFLKIIAENNILFYFSLMCGVSQKVLKAAMPEGIFKILGFHIIFFFNYEKLSFIALVVETKIRDFFFFFFCISVLTKMLFGWS